MSKQTAKRFTFEQMSEAVEMAGFTPYHVYSDWATIPFHKSVPCKRHCWTRYDRISGYNQWVHIKVICSTEAPSARAITAVYNQNMKNLAKYKIEVDPEIAAVLKHCT